MAPCKQNTLISNLCMEVNTVSQRSNVDLQGNHITNTHNAP